VARSSSPCDRDGVSYSAAAAIPRPSLIRDRGRKPDKDELEGKLKQGEGKLTGDRGREAEGEAQSAYGHGNEAAGDAADAARDKVDDLKD
jgi:uncharacterized protein YjbJ (UPF0337 family)